MGAEAARIADLFVVLDHRDHVTSGERGHLNEAEANRACADDRD